MSIVKNILEKLTKLSAIAEEAKEAVTLMAAKLEDGTEIEAEEFEIGYIASVDAGEGQMIPLPAGTYNLDNGNAITTDDNGVIMSVNPIEETPTEEAPAEAPAMEAGEAKPETQMEAKKIIETNATTKETVFSAAEVEAKLSAEREAFNAKIEALQAEMAKLSAQPAAQPLSRAPRKAVEDVTYYDKPKNTAEKLINLSSKIKAKIENGQ
jgi:hypothetical protein